MTLLWRRAIGDPHYLRVFCLAHAEKLSYQVCDAALRLLAELSQGRDGEGYVHVIAFVSMCVVWVGVLA